MLVGFLLAFSAALTEVAYAAGSSNTYSTPCTIAASSFNQGSTVYGGGSGLTGATVNVEYVDSTGATAQTSTGVTVSSGTACDSTGYLLPSNAPTGTWTLRICTPGGGNCHNLGQGQQASNTFQVNAAVPEFPFGAVALLVPVTFAYFLAKRRRLS